ncbi:MAG: phosphopyruvate hydratase [Deltaproteobacteria bacterium]|nr:phosphopyruvate hydratase [Deltaproteobacteria bacterium]
MKDPKISKIKAREVLDSKGRPMVETDVWTTSGAMGRGSSPCGTSVGSHEAFVLRDGGDRLGGLGVLKAVHNVTEIVAPALVGKSVTDQRGIDNLMIELDGTADKSRLGGNAIYSVSVAAARAAAHSLELPLYRYLGGDGANNVPIPMFNMINGGKYGDRYVELQEFLLVPARARSYAEALRMGVEVFYALAAVIKKRCGPEHFQFGHSAGYAAPAGDPEENIELLLLAVEEAGYGDQFKIGLDCAASHFYDKKLRLYNFRGKKVGREEFIGFLEKLAGAYHVFLIEDPLNEDDFEGFADISRRLDLLICGDDLFVTCIERLKKGVQHQAADAMVLKPNMVGTLSEALDAARYAKEHGYVVIPSIRAGGAVDDPTPDVAVAVSAPLIKCGAPRSGERTTCQNRLLQIEEELGSFVGFPSFEMIERTTRPSQIKE